VLAWRQRLQATGVSMRHFPTSIEALLRRAMKGGSPFRINPRVDFYNAVSLRRVVPVGGFDLDRVPGPLSVRLTRDGDTFSALDADGAVPVPPGELAYATGTTVLTRQFMWREVARGAEPSRDPLRVSRLREPAGGRPRDGGDRPRGPRRRLARDFGASVKSFMVDAATPRIEW
jgi:B3/4 domain-containing protein